MSCRGCGTENRHGRKFCVQCGVALEVGCPSCGAVAEPRDRFRGECGAPLAGSSAAPAGVSPSTQPQVPERRLVTVLFADLVGFTTLSERRDPEEVRGLLSRYFDRCRTLIGRYGGTVAKFIGDAVMALWGAPVAREDDAERAVRTAVPLTQTVAPLGEGGGMAELQVGAGALTGHAAVNLAAEGEGMVLGDTVNTASRLQTLASPGTVLVDDVTRRASDAAIAYDDACGLQQARQGELAEAETALAHAATTLRDTGNPYSYARALFDDGAVLIKLGRTGDGVTVLQKARALFMELGATPWIERTDAALAQETAVA